jgi:hypothetical protein
MFAILDTAVRLYFVVSIISALLLPDELLIVTHDWSHVTVQLVLDIILNVLKPFTVEAIFKLLVETDKYANTPSCDTLMVCDGRPTAETVIFAVRITDNEFCVAETITIPLFTPEPGVTVNQLSLLVAVQFVLLITLNVSELPSLALIFKVDVERLKLLSSCNFDEANN